MPDREPRKEKLLEGRVALVTGGASGIGRAIAREFIAHGAKVAVFDKQDSSEAREEFSAAEALFINVDITDNTALKTALGKVQDALGTVNTLVNNAAIDPKESFIRNTSLDKWTEVMNTNLTSAFFLTQFVSNRMRERQVGGSIIFITSVHTAHAFEGDAPYDASKTGLIGLMQNAALELGKHGIRANAIAPGLINNTGMSNVTGELLTKAEQATPLRRAGKPEDIASVAVFLASDMASFVTGQEIRADGGVTIKSPLPF